MQGRRQTDPNPRATDRRAARLSERFLKIATGVALLVLTTVSIVAISFLPDVAPDNVNFWRLILGVPAMLMALALIFVGPRLSTRTFQIGIELMSIAVLGVNLIILQLTPATIAVLFNMLATMIYAGYFARRFALGVTIVGGAAIALSTLFIEPASQTAHLGAFLMVYVPTMVVMGLLLHLQNSETLEALHQTRRRAMEDPLTGLANLRALERAAHKRFNQKSRGDRGGMTGLLLIDLDNFKSANSQHGHVGGDHALRMIAHQLMRVAPKDAVVARVGGDEFAVLMSAESSARVAETGAIFRGAVRAASSIMEMPGVEIDAAVGMAVYPDDGRDLSELLDKADRVMYEEKGAKRHAFPNLESVPIDPSARPAWLAAERESEVEPKRRHASLDSATGGNLPRFAGLTLYARTSAMAWAFGSVVLGLSLALPSSAQSTLPWWLALFGGLALSAGILRVNAEPQSRTHLLFDSMALLGVAGLIALTGGLQSAAPPLLILLAASQAWFWNTKMVAARTIGPVAVALSPLLYDSLGGGAQTSIELVMLFAESAMIVAVVLSMYFDRVLLSKLQESAHELAMTDPLTGINNRRAFNAFVQDLIDDEHSEQFAIVMIDLDNFKQVNTLRGHRGGDAVLIAIAKSLHASAREDDCIARIGGDEFAAVLPGVGVDGARTLAERFVQTISNTPEASDSHVGASAGFALHPLHGETLDGLVFTADSALMAVKASGKGSARVARVVSAV